jgi:hypothetical protein
MYTTGRVVHVLIVHFHLTPLIPLPLKAKLSKVTPFMTILTVIPHHSLGMLVHSLVGMVHSWRWVLCFQKGFLRDGRIHTCF